MIDDGALSQSNSQLLQLSKGECVVRVSRQWFVKEELHSALPHQVLTAHWKEVKYVTSHPT